MEKIRGEFIEIQKVCDHSSDESLDESHYEDNERQLGAKKKRLISGPKRAIQTIYTETSTPPEASIDNGGI